MENKTFLKWPAMSVRSFTSTPFGVYLISSCRICALQNLCNKVTQDEKKKVPVGHIKYSVSWFVPVKQVLGRKDTTARPKNVVFHGLPSELRH